MFKRLLISIFLLSCNYIYSQSQNRQVIDSLLHSYKNTTVATKKVDLLNLLGREFRNTGFKDSSLVYTTQAKLILDKIDYPKGEIATLLNFSITYRELKMYPEALENTEKLIALCETENDQIRKGDAFDNLAHINYEKNNITQAIKRHFIALKLREDAGDTYGVGNSCDNIAHIYSASSRYRDALKYFMRSRNTFKKIGDLSRETLSTANVGLQLYLQGNYPASLLCFYNALENYNTTKNEDGIAWMYRCIGEVLNSSGNIEQAIEYFNLALPIEEKLHNKENISEIYNHIGKASLALEKYEDALEFQNKALQISVPIEDWDGVVKSYYYMAKTKLMMGNLEQALFYSKTAIDFALNHNVNHQIATLNSLMGEINLKLNKPEEAKKWLLNAIKNQNVNQTGANLFSEYQLLSESEAEIGNFEKAFKYQKMSVALFNDLETQKATKLATRYETNKKELFLRTQQEQKDFFNIQELNKKQTQRNTAIIGLVFMSLLSISLLYLFHFRSKKIEIERQNLQLKHREADAIQETEHFKSKFIANISHEFRTLLTLIKGHIELLNQDLEVDSLKSLEQMNQNGDRLLELVNQLLDLSKIKNGKYVLTYTQDHLLEKVQAYIYSFESFATKKNLNFKVEISERAEQLKTNKIWHYSADALQIIISNLLSNAIKFTPPNGEIFTRIDFNNDTLLVCVSDSGIGISEENLEYVFERFFQIETTTNPPQKGSGIGLSLVKELAILHQGKVSVKNNPKKGCTFSVSLKCEPVKNQEISTNLIVDQQEKPLILIVEDQPELRRFICNNIGEEFQFLEAVNGQEGILLAEKHLPDLIISDVMMPLLNGFEMCQHLKNTDSTSHIPIMLLSGMTDSSDRLKGIEMGADAYLSKPFSVEELRLRIKNVFKLLQNIQSKLQLGQISKEEEIKGLSKRDFELVKKLKATINDNISNPKFGVGNLADVAFLSQSQLTRKLKAILGQTPSDLIKTSRLTKALELLQKEYNVSETSWAVGFEDSQYFSKVFKKYYGVIPSEHFKIKES